MAFEQCHYQNEAYVCNHIIFLDYLIDNEKDVDLLVKKGIIMRVGDSAAVANIINKLSGGVQQFGSYYSDIATRVNAYYDEQLSRYNWRRSKLKRVYFPDLWTGSATVAAISIVLLTIAQVVLGSLQL